MQIKTVSTAARRQRQSYNSGQFTRTVLITPETEQAIKAGEVSLKRGQWIMDSKSGLRGQFVQTKSFKRMTRPASFFRKAEFEDTASIEMRPYVSGRKFAEYQRGV